MLDCNKITIRGTWSMRGSILLLLVGTLIAEAALACPACGDKLNFGGGMGFERMTRSKTAGHVALLTSVGSAQVPAKAAAEIGSLLEKAGHDVEVAGDDAALRQLQDHHAIDVVIVHWPQAAEATTVLGDVKSGPSVLAVAFDADDAAAAKSSGTTGCLARVDHRRGRNLLEAVDRIIEQRNKGTAPECTLTVARQSE
jgi:hypothetical protein